MEGLDTGLGEKRPSSLMERAGGDFEERLGEGLEGGEDGNH